MEYSRIVIWFRRLCMKGSIVVAIISCIVLSCTSSKDTALSNNFFIDATKHEILKLKDVDVKAILFVGYKDIDIAEGKMLIGDPNEFKKITNKNYEFSKIVNDKKWINLILDEYKRAIREARWQGSASDARVIFITKEKGYMLRWDCDDKVVYNEYLSSAKLWQYLNEIGFIEHEKSRSIPEFKRSD
jgi:hypothetical protein